MMGRKYMGISVFVGVRLGFLGSERAICISLIEIGVGMDVKRTEGIGFECFEAGEVCGKKVMGRKGKKK